MFDGPRSPLIALALMTVAGGCGKEGPTDVDGTYRVLNVSDGSNECMLADWKEGDQQPAASIVMVQDPKDRSKLTGTIEGLATLAALAGSRTFTGTLRGDQVSLELDGSPAPETAGGCTFTRTALLDADAIADYLAGGIGHRFETNEHPDCGYRTTCVSVQDFTAKRTR